MEPIVTSANSLSFYDLKSDADLPASVVRSAHSSDCVMDDKSSDARHRMIDLLSPPRSTK